MLAIGQLFAQKTTFSKPEQIGYQPMLGLFAALLVLAFLQTQPSEILIAQSLVPMLKSMFEFEEYGTVVAVLQIVAQLITLLFIALLIPLAYAFASTALERKRLSGLTLRYSISAVLASLVILYLIGLAISFVVLKLITSFKFLYFAQEFFGLLRSSDVNNSYFSGNCGMQAPQHHRLADLCHCRWLCTCRMLFADIADSADIVIYAGKFGICSGCDMSAGMVHIFSDAGLQHQNRYECAGSYQRASYPVTTSLKPPCAYPMFPAYLGPYLEHMSDLFKTFHPHTV